MHGSITAGMWPQEFEPPVRYAPEANQYIAHRLTIQVGPAMVACDCGRTFTEAVDLEHHQHAYRHPGLSAVWEDLLGERYGW